MRTPAAANTSAVRTANSARQLHHRVRTAAQRHFRTQKFVHNGGLPPLGKRSRHATHDVVATASLARKAQMALMPIVKRIVFANYPGDFHPSIPPYSHCIRDLPSVKQESPAYASNSCKVFYHCIGGLWLWQSCISGMGRWVFQERERDYGAIQLSGARAESPAGETRH